MAKSTRQHRPGRRPARGRRLAPGPALRADLGPLPGAAQLLATTRSPPPAPRWTGSTRCVAALAAYREDRADDPELPRRPRRDPRAGFEAALDDDLNVCAALGALFDGVRELNRRIDARLLSTADAERAAVAIRDLDTVLGVAAPAEEALDPELQALLDERAAARAARDWAASDRLRDELLARGIAVEDTRDGQRWRQVVAAGG